MKARRRWRWRSVSPWLALVDDAKYQATVDRVAALRPTTIVGCHTPVIGPAHVSQALDVARRTPTTVVPPEPDQNVLDAILAGSGN